MGCNSACIKDYPGSLHLTWSFGDELLDEANIVLLRPTLVAMVTTIVEFGQKLIEMVDVVVVGLVVVVVVA